MLERFRSLLGAVTAPLVVALDSAGKVAVNAVQTASRAVNGVLEVKPAIAEVRKTRNGPWGRRQKYKPRLHARRGAKRRGSGKTAARAKLKGKRHG